MFLRSTAYQALNYEPSRWNWHSTTVLMVSYDWDPLTGGAEALAGRRLASALLDAGASVHVLTARESEPCHPSSNYTATVVADRPVAESRVRLGLQMMRYRIPEPYFFWVPDAVSHALRLAGSLPARTVILSRAMPGASNIVAWHVARATGLPWVAHFSDEWPGRQVLSNGRRWFAPYKPPLFALWRRRILRDAGALTFTNPRQAAAVLRSSARRHAGKSFVVTHLPSSTRTPPPQQQRVFHIVHTGNLYPPGHSAKTLVCGLQLFLERTPAAQGRVKLTQAGWFAGDLPEWSARCGLEGVVQNVGRLAPDALTALIDDASLLVGIDYARADSATLLSKLPDYVVSRRPILVITGSDSAMHHLFKEDGVGLTADYRSPDEVARRIAAVFEAWRGHRTDAFLPTPLAVQSFERSRVLGELAAAFVTAKRARRAGAATPTTAIGAFGRKTA